MTAPLFKISTFCKDGGCVSVASLGGKVVVRDDKIPHGPVLIFTADEWDAFVAGVKDGQFDRQTLELPQASYA
jgi:Domain of unknown function (DUF397)